MRAVARQQRTCRYKLAQQDISNRRQVVCVGERRTVHVRRFSQLERDPYFFGTSQNKKLLHTQYVTLAAHARYVTAAAVAFATDFSVNALCGSRVLVWDATRVFGGSPWREGNNT